MKKNQEGAEVEQLKVVFEPLEPKGPFVFTFQRINHVSKRTTRFLTNRKLFTEIQQTNLSEVIKSAIDHNCLNDKPEQIRCEICDSCILWSFDAETRLEHPFDIVFSSFSSLFKENTGKYSNESNIMKFDNLLLLRTYIYFILNRPSLWTLTEHISSNKQITPSSINNKIGKNRSKNNNQAEEDNMNTFDSLGAHLQRMKEQKMNYLLDKVFLYDDFESGNFQSYSMKQEGKQVYIDVVLRADTNTSGFCEWFNFKITTLEPCTLNIRILNITNQNLNRLPIVSTVNGTSFSIEECENVRICEGSLDIPDSANLDMRQLRRYDSYEAEIKKSQKNLGQQTQERIEFQESEGFSEPLENINGSKKFKVLSFVLNTQKGSLFRFVSLTFPFHFSDMIRYFDRIEETMYNKPIDQQLFDETDRSIKINNETISYSRKIIGASRLGLPIYLLKITNAKVKTIKRKRRKPIYFIGRLRGKDAPSNYFINGLLSFLLSDSPQADLLRELFVFRIIPMLNPDGVVLGNSKSSLSGLSLRNSFAQPDQKLTPEICALDNELKRTIQGSKKKKPKEIFMIGEIACSSKYLVNASDEKQRRSYIKSFEIRKEKFTWINIRLLTKILQSHNKVFDYSLSKFDMSEEQDNKEVFSTPKSSEKFLQKAKREYKILGAFSLKLNMGGRSTDEYSNIGKDFCYGFFDYCLQVALMYDAKIFCPEYLIDDTNKSEQFKKPDNSFQIFSGSKRKSEIVLSKTQNISMNVNSKPFFLTPGLNNEKKGTGPPSPTQDKSTGVTTAPSKDLAWTRVRKSISHSIAKLRPADPYYLNLIKLIDDIKIYSMICKPAYIDYFEKGEIPELKTAIEIEEEMARALMIANSNSGAPQKTKSTYGIASLFIKEMMKKAANSEGGDGNIVNPVRLPTPLQNESPSTISNAPSLASINIVINNLNNDPVSDEPPVNEDDYQKSKNYKASFSNLENIEEKSRIESETNSPVKPKSRENHYLDLESELARKVSGASLGILSLGTDIENKSVSGGGGGMDNLFEDNNGNNGNNEGKAEGKEEKQQKDLVLPGNVCVIKKNKPKNPFIPESTELRRLYTIRKPTKQTKKTENPEQKYNHKIRPGLLGLKTPNKDFPLKTEARQESAARSLGSLLTSSLFTPFQEERPIILAGLGKRVEELRNPAEEFNSGRLESRDGYEGRMYLLKSNKLSKTQPYFKDYLSSYDQLPNSLRQNYIQTTTADISPTHIPTSYSINGVYLPSEYYKSTLSSITNVYGYAPKHNQLITSQDFQTCRKMNKTKYSFRKKMEKSSLALTKVCFQEDLNCEVEGLKFPILKKPGKR